MAEATILRSMSGDEIPESSSGAVARNVDPMSMALRATTPLSIDEIVDLNRQACPAAVASSSGTKLTTVWSTPKESSGTKPTSAGTTSYNVEDYFGKGKATATYASSVSATQGSGSDTEKETNRNNDLFEIGGQFDDGLKLKTPPQARSKRQQNKRRRALKKPDIIIHQRNIDVIVDVDVDADGAASSSDEEAGPAAKQVTGRDRREKTYLRPRRTKPAPQQEQLSPAELEAGRSQVVPLTTAPPALIFRNLRFVALIIAIGLTFSLSVFAAHYTGRGRMNCTKGIIFAGSVLMSVLTMLAMLVARRTLLEALFAGIFEFLIGFCLVIEIHELMEPGFHV